jgi:hypothetical protein
MTFNHDTFASQMNQYTGITVATKNGAFDWDQWIGTSGDLNKELDYAKNGFDYRTWWQEVTVMKENAGMLVSSKIDFANGLGDDHMILLTGFMATSSGPKMIFAQISVQFHGDDSDNIMSDPITTGDIGQGIYDTLNSQIISKDFGSSDTAKGRQTFPDIARANVNSMIHSVA